MNSRKSIFDIERRVNLRTAWKNLISDIKSTHVYFNGENNTLYYFLDKYIKTWPYRQAARSLEVFATSHSFKLNGSTDNDMILSIELVLNLLYWLPAYEDTLNDWTMDILQSKASAMTNECCNYCEDIEFLLEKINMRVRKVSKDNSFPQYIINKRDTSVDVALENVPELAEVLLSYFDIRNQDDLTQKQIILKQIADYLEPKKSQYNGTQYSGLYRELFKVFNRCGIRHNDKRQIQMGDTQRMELFDATFKAAVHLMQAENVNEFYKLAGIVD